MHRKWRHQTLETLVCERAYTHKHTHAQEVATPDSRDSVGADEADSEMWGKMRGSAGSRGGGGREGGGREGEAEIDHIESEESGMWGRMRLPWRGEAPGRGGGIGFGYNAAEPTSHVSLLDGEVVTLGDETLGAVGGGGSRADEGLAGSRGQGADSGTGDGDIRQVKNGFRIRSYFSQLDLRTALGGRKDDLNV
jgi:hypothetical protein